MRPLRLLALLSSAVTLVALLVCTAIAKSRHAGSANSLSGQDGRLPSRFAFHLPPSLFPPSAIISLTDDNSTFFLARPAAFGPLLPAKGLSAPLWIGSGFGGDEYYGRGGVAGSAEGELGCSDVPGWTDEVMKSRASVEAVGKGKKAGSSASPNRARRDQGKFGSQRTDHSPTSQKLEDKGTSAAISDGDGTDDYLHQPLSESRIERPGSYVPEKTPPESHADIQSLQEGAEIAGKVVLLSRGGCGFLEKTKWVQRRGGVALIVGDNVRGGPLVAMYARGETNDITIPSLFTSHTTAHLLSSLLPPGGLVEDTGAESMAKLGIRPDAPMNSKKRPGKQKIDGTSSTRTASTPASTVIVSTSAPTTSKTTPARSSPSTAAGKYTTTSGLERSWIGSLLYALTFGAYGSDTFGDLEASRRPPSSGNLDWPSEEENTRSSMKARVAGASQPTNPAAQQSQDQARSQTSADTFVIGVQDWRDPDLVEASTPAGSQDNASRGAQSADHKTDSSQSQSKTALPGGSITPGSGEYEDRKSFEPGWFSNILHSDDGSSVATAPGGYTGDVPDMSGLPSSPSDDDSEPFVSDFEEYESTSSGHRGLWVTLTPTSVSTSPFFDTLLVLVVSPLVTLTVVYALLLLRARIRRRRWRAPKSVVDRLPVRTYHTLSPRNSTVTSPVTSPAASSPTTPLLQRSATSPGQRPRSATTSNLPDQIIALSGPPATVGSAATEQEKTERGLAEWRRKYGGKQVECVVCLEEYIDGVSRVMSLPCGHEFHADCM